ncbi:MAG TPA: hypothetical protein PK870_07090 [Clostridia bacterium]|nr:hypothetical protein [Clostridia bacterium]
MRKVKVFSLVLCLILVCSLVFTACDNKPTDILHPYQLTRICKT